MTAVDAARLWAEMREEVSDYDVNLVSPAVNYCYGNCVEEVNERLDRSRFCFLIADSRPISCICACTRSLA